VVKASEMLKDGRKDNRIPDAPPVRSMNKNFTLEQLFADRDRAIRSRRRV
jgi:hypothetical protein